MRHARCRLFLLLILLLALCLVFPAAAEESSDEENLLPDSYLEWLNAIPEELCEFLPEGLFSKDAEEVAAALSEMSNVSYLIKTVLAMVGVRLEACGSVLATVTGLLLLSAVVSALKSTFSNPGIARAFGLCSVLAITGAILAQTYHSMQGVTNYLTLLGTLTSAALPMIAALYLMGGNVGAAAAAGAGLGAFLSVLEGVIAQSILPFCGICMALALLGALDSSMRTGSLLNTLKRNYTTLLGFLMTLLLAMLGTQHLLAVKGDTVAMRGVKFAAGSLLPVVGSSVAELMRTVSAGVGYLRGIAGACGILVLLLTLLPTLVELLLLRLVWQICASLADLLGCDCEKRLMEEFASVLGFLATAVSICSSVFLIALTLLAKCASAIG